MEYRGCLYIVSYIFYDEFILFLEKEYKEHCTISNGRLFFYCNHIEICCYDDRENTMSFNKYCSVSINNRRYSYMPLEEIFDILPYGLKEYILFNLHEFKRI